MPFTVNETKEIKGNELKDVLATRYIGQTLTDVFYAADVEHLVLEFANGSLLRFPMKGREGEASVYTEWKRPN